MARHPQPTFSRNRLLSILAAEDFERLRPSLERVSLRMKQALEQPNKPIGHVYFPEPGVASVVAVTPSGIRMEVGLIGPEGMSGLAILQGGDRAPYDTFVQVPGEAIRISADALRAALLQSETLRLLFLRYAQAFSVQVAFTALANGQLNINQRLARWLLMCHDRVDGGSFPITHQFLALMLGVRRAGVTTALQSLEKRAALTSTRGRIVILDRDALVLLAGDTYGVPEAEYERLIGHA